MILRKSVILCTLRMQLFYFEFGEIEFCSVCAFCVSPALFVSFHFREFLGYIFFDCILADLRNIDGFFGMNTLFIFLSFLLPDCQEAQKGSSESAQPPAIV